MIHLLRYLTTIAFFMGMVMVRISPAGAEQTKTLVFSEIAHSSTGIIARTILQEAYARLGIQATGNILPTARALDDSSSGITDGEMLRIFDIGEKYPSLLRVDPHILSLDGMAFVKGEPFPIQGPESLRPYRIGIPLGIEYARKLFDEDTFDVVASPDSDRLFEMLEKNRIDVAVMVRLAGMRRLRKLGYTDIRPLEPPLTKVKLYHYLHKKHASLLPRITAVLTQMKESGEIDRIVKKVIAKTHPDQTVPDQTSSNQTGSDQPDPNQTGSDQPDPNQTDPAN